MLLSNINSVLKILAALLLVALNGLFVAAEFAFVRVRPTRITQLASQGDHRAIRAQRCINNIDTYLSVSQLGITLASLGLGWLGEPALARLLTPLLLAWGIKSIALVHSISFVFAFGIITFLHVVFGELAPKSLAIDKAESLSLSLSGPMQFFYFIFYPGVVLLNGSANRLIRLFGLQVSKGHEITHTEEELRMIISASYKEGQINKNEQELLQNVFKFEKKVAEDIMVPRPEVVFLHQEYSLENNLQIAREAMHTRFPLCDGSPDHITGLIHIKDIIHADPGHVSIQDLKRNIMFVPEGISLEKLLQDFRNEHQHIAVVVDEYGGTAGIVTMDNILEELVGDIQDEFDQEEPEIRLQSDGTLSISGRMYINEAIENLGLPINKDLNYYNTLAGYVMGQLDSLPRIGDAVNLGIFKLEVERMEGMRIDRLRLYPVPKDVHL